MMKRVAQFWVAMIAAGASGFAASVDYVREVKPVLAGHCYKCHGPSQQKGGLRMDTAAFARKGGENGTLFEPGHSRGSLLLKVVTGEHAEIPRMPYKKPPLPVAEVALLTKWIDEGAQAPADEKPATETHWAFVAPVRSVTPPVKREDWVRNPVDRFILARLEREGIAPSPEADRVTLIRRLNLDLLGLPPTPQEVAEFVNDRRADAYDRAVERLLASPHYGERWGRWWLDAARYADSNGYSIDAPRQIWKYRDWVVSAFNRDLPFDRFVIEQLAGDLLPDATVEQRIATGFHRNTQINQEGGIDPEQFRVECVVDRVNTTATVFLGVTLACAQCHDHKFDPFTQREYYQMFAFFNSQVEDGHGQAVPLGMLEVPGEVEPMSGIDKEITELEEDLDRYLNTQGSALQKWEDALTAEEKAKLEPEVQDALKVAFADRKPKLKRAVYRAFRADDPEFKQRNGRLTKLLKREPKPVTTLVMQELAEPRETHLLVKGDFTRPGDKVTPGLPAVLTAFDTTADRGRSEPVAASSTFGATSLLNRLDLAGWIVATNNPLTARVIVNRVWQQYFGRGIVGTENDFGSQGIPPTHPELLDWLACEFMRPSGTDGSRIQHPESGIQPAAWSLKQLHRVIVTSATYRQSSRVRRDLADTDPDNRLLARQSRLRLDAEAVRDVALAVSGMLSPKVGGPPVYPPQPDGVMNLGQMRRSWKASEGDDRRRRGLYTHLWRATPHPALAVFDAPDGFNACTRRLRSNTPLQALTLLNDQQYYEMAEALAARVLVAVPESDADRIDYAFQVCVGRRPAPDEKQRMEELLESERRPSAGDGATQAAGAWIAVARVLLNLDETITRE